MAKRDRSRNRGSRKEEHQQAKADRANEGFGSFPGVLVSEEALTKLGITEFTCEMDEGETSKAWRIQVLQSHKDDANLIGLKLFLHEKVGTEGADFLCPKAMRAYLHKVDMPIPDAISEGRCPICERLEVLVERYKKDKQNLDDDTRNVRLDELKALRNHGGRWNDFEIPKKFLTWCVDCTSPESEELGVRVYRMQRSVWDGLVDEMEGMDENEFRDFLDPDDPYLFAWKRVGTKKETRYGSFKSRKNEDLPDEWLDDVPLYLDVLKFATYDEIKEAFDAVSEPDPEKDDVAEDLGREFSRTKDRKTKDDVPKEEGGRRRRRRAPIEDDDDEPTPPAEVDALPEDDDAETSDRVKRMRARRAKKLAGKDD